MNNKGYDTIQKSSVPEKIGEDLKKRGAKKIAMDQSTTGYALVCKIQGNWQIGIGRDNKTIPTDEEIKEWTKILFPKIKEWTTLAGNGIVMLFEKKGGGVKRNYKYY